MAEKHTRRSFVSSTIAAGAALALSGGRARAARTGGSDGAGVPTRSLGKTGVKVSMIGLGGWHIAGAVKDKAEAIRIMHAAIDAGVTFFDNAWEYNRGASEEVMGEALAQGGKRQKVFLMTKNCERDYAGSKRNLEDSLRRLKTDHVDLWQFHELIYDNDPEWVFEKGGLKAALEAQKAGKVRFIGFTGHRDPRIFLDMIGRPHSWDAVQMPTNVMDAHYRSFQREVIPVCQRKQIGVIGMKSMGGGRIVKEAGLSARDCLRYALSLPIATLVVGFESLAHLQEAVEVARGFSPMSDSEKQKLLARVRDVATDGRYELFKTTQQFDSRVHRSQHGFPVPS